MNILIIEDNRKLANNVAVILKENTYNAMVSYKGKDGLEKALKEDFDLIILDLALPDIDGIDVCKKLRSNKKKTPILMLTARIDIESKVEGLDCGADDYLTKPFESKELLARIRALTRRSSQVKRSKIKVGKSIEVDLASKSVRKNKTEIDLSPIEMRILEFLLLNKGKAKSAVEIYESAWGTENSEVLFSNSLKVHIAHLRRKLGNDIIKTVKGYGYMI